jgi:transcriptional regulator of acetoin/glycerol metabolism
VTGHSSTTLTTEISPQVRGGDDDDGPGIVAVFSVNQPHISAHPLRADPLTIGRRAEGGLRLPLDSRLSRNHVQLHMIDNQLRVLDLESHNGTFVDGVRITQTTRPNLPRTLRVGDTLFIFVPRVGPFLTRGVDVRGEVVVGPVLAEVRDKLARVAAARGNVLLTGPTGVGKELAARHFHASGPSPAGPFAAVNCAAIPPALAERLLFGAQRGAYSGADANADGYVFAAHGGTLFLDEIAELELTVQAKLLRVLETKEVLPLGATRTKKVAFQLCAATLKDLKGEVAAGRFREDLYHRVGRPEVRVPSLVERLEELPWIAARELRRIDERLVPTASFVEACLLREWPGNVRELLREMQEAALTASTDARTLIYAADLSTLDTDRAGSPPTRGNEPAPAVHSREEILEALRGEGGNVSSAARRLGMHRNQLRRWLSGHGFDVNEFRDQSESPFRPQITPVTAPDVPPDDSED